MNNIVRRIVGGVGFFIPALCMLYNYLFNEKVIQHSVSHYYFSPGGTIFTLTMGLLSAFFIIYKGYDKYDKLTTVLIGMAGTIIILFPTNANEDSLYQLKVNTGTIHMIASAVFFILIAYMIGFRFTKSNGAMTKRKLERNKVYRYCSVVIISAVAAIAITTFLNANHLTIWLEWVCISAFSIAYLIKGETILKDE